MQTETAQLEIDARRDLRLRIKVRGLGIAKLRWWCAGAVMRLAAIVAGAPLDVELVSEA